jgi:hypothetical protein
MKEMILMGSKRHEMFREVRKLGFEIVNGRKHYRVIDPATGAQVAVLPRGQNAYGGGRNGRAVLVQLRRRAAASTVSRHEVDAQDRRDTCKNSPERSVNARKRNGASGFPSGTARAGDTRRPRLG